MTAPIKNWCRPPHRVGRIEICGGIASGKTTLTKLMGHSQLTPVLENFLGNPFWKAFYADPVGNAFETEVSFLLQHYHDIKTASNRGNLFACDFSLLLDAAYAQVTLDDGKRAAFAAVYRAIQAELPPTDLVIHLMCDPATELERIRRRGREVEQSITVEYLDAINRALSDVIHDEANSGQVVAINSATIDFANNESDRKHVSELILARMNVKVGDTV